ncbi:MAG TPA: tyrosine decarboxylase MfnA, partial [Methanotrichaceae archaeon]|nr:tyrosine decarboxylase MfnA [Methanotrichaceae archaeon]
MREESRSEEEVLLMLEEMRSRDYSYDRFFSTMCTQPHPIAVRAHNLFLETNLGDPGLFPGVAELEHRAIGMMSKLLGCPKAVGYIST